MKHALSVSRTDDFSAWYQELIKEADLAEESGVRGCMVIKPWGWGIWERIQLLMDRQIKAAGVENCYFPLFIPLSYFAREADHVDGFAKEMAVVTHHRLIADGKGGLVPDPDSKLEEPLIVRPTSETVIGAAMARWVQSWRDLPLKTNQWANVVRWEMRTRMFLRTSEFLWQEGHTAHADRADAMVETERALEMYRAFAEGPLAMPVIAGEKPPHERFPGAVATYSIEAMMQDGKALQAGTSHYLGTTFAEAAGIRYQDKDGAQTLCHTTSWGVSTRMIGGVIMTHGDDDGLCCPPQIAPWQVVIVPMLKYSNDAAASDEAILSYCQSLADELRTQMAFAEPVRVLVDVKFAKAATKRWSWVKKGAPIIIEVGPRDVADGKAAVIRRDQLYRDDGKLATVFADRASFISDAGRLLQDIQTGMHRRATKFRDDNIKPMSSWSDLEHYFAGHDTDVKGWALVPWSRPEGAELDDVVARLKALKLTARNTPMDGKVTDQICLFTNKPATEMILIGRTY